jgi:hypothetical protein
MHWKEKKRLWQKSDLQSQILFLPGFLLIVTCLKLPEEQGLIRYPDE